MKKKKLRKVLDEMIYDREEKLKIIDAKLVMAEEKIYIESIKEEKRHLRREINLIKGIKGYLEEE